jgi:hypothetical protein
MGEPKRSKSVMFKDNPMPNNFEHVHPSSKDMDQDIPGQVGKSYIDQKTSSA